MPYTQAGLPYAPQSDTSRDAATRAQKFVGKQGIEVLAWFQGRGGHGGTQKEASQALDIDRASICARVNALEKVGNLVKTSQRRDGCAVYRSV